MISPSSGAKAPAFSIVVHEKGGAERREVFESTEISVGRVQGNDIVLPKGNVSKRHARLLYRDGRFIVTDLNSTNGTYVNRRRIAQATIVRDGDRIYVGDFVLRIEQPGEPASSGEPNGEAADPARSTSRTDSKPPSIPSEQSPRVTLDSVSDENAGRPTAHSFDAHTPAAATRSTPDVADTLEPTDLREVLGALIARAAERFGVRDLKRPADPALEQNLDQMLRELCKPLEKEAGGFDVERVLARARAELLEFGPLGEPLKDAAIVEIGVPRFDRVILGRSGRSNAVLPGFSSELSLGWALQRLCEEAGTPLRSDEVNVERRLPNGATLYACLGSGPSQGTVLVIRRPRRTTLTLEELVRRGTISRAIATFLQHCISARLNLLVIGARDGGPETMLGALAMTQVEGTPVWISEAGNPPFAAMPRVDASLAPERLVHAVELAGRIPGARLIADLTRPALVSAVIAAIGDGADGVVAARAGTGLGRALARLTAELSLTGSTMNPLSARELVASSFDVAVEIAQLRDGRYRVLRVAEISGTSPDGFQLNDIFSFVADRTAAGGVIEGTFSPAGTPPRLVESLRARGIQIDTALFSRPLAR